MVDSLKFNYPIVSSFVYDNCGYFGTDASILLKIDRTNFTLVASAELSQNVLSNPIVDGDKVYFASISFYLVAFNLSSFSEVLHPQQFPSVSSAMAYDGFGFFVPRFQSYLLKVNLTSLAVLGNLTLNTATNFGIADNHLAYFATDTGVILVNLDTLQLVNSTSGTQMKTGAILGDVALFASYQLMILNLSTFSSTTASFPTMHFLDKEGISIKSI